MMKELLTAEEVAEILNVRRARVYDLARRGFLPAIKLGRQLRFKPEDLEKFIEEGGRGLSG